MEDVRKPATWKSRLVFWLKVLVSLGLVIYLLWLVDWELAAKAISAADKLPLLLGPAIFVFGMVFAALRWRLILGDNRVAFSLWQAYSGYLVGLFYSIFLPGVIGGDVVRVARSVGQTKCPIGTATASVLLERMCGVLALLGMALLSFLLFPSTFRPLVPASAKLPIVIVGLLGSVGLIGVIATRKVWLKWLPPENSVGLLGFVRSGLSTVGILRLRTVVLILVLSALYQATDIVATYMFSQAIGLDVPLMVYFVIIPVTYLVTILPISLGGLGVREGTLVFLLGQFGVGTSEAVILSFLVYINRVVSGVLGGFVQLAETLANRQRDRAVEDVSI